ncbi:MAG: diguanylate cyclase [Candidatus Acidiferrum sp.]
MTTRSTNYNVLVVDDSPVYRKLIGHILGKQFHTLSYAESGTEALRVYKSQRPDIVVTDWMMPDLSGIELCRAIRRDETEPYTYLILMTGNADHASVVEGLKAGADDYLTKPFDSGEMLARIGVGQRIIDLNRELAEQNARMTEAAQTDALTGLPNRRAIEAWTSRQLFGATRYGFSVWVILSDLNSFKTINDSFGHDAGDLVLKAFADILKKNTRRSDISGRLGGDEFIQVITHSVESGIEPIVKRIKRELADKLFLFGGQSVKVGASFGVAQFEGNSVEDFALVLRKADQMLYKAKREERSNICVCGLSGTAPNAILDSPQSSNECSDTCDEEKLKEVSHR